MVNCQRGSPWKQKDFQDDGQKNDLAFEQKKKRRSSATSQTAAGGRRKTGLGPMEEKTSVPAGLTAGEGGVVEVALETESKGQQGSPGI